MSGNDEPATDGGEVDADEPATDGGEVDADEPATNGGEVDDAPSLEAYRYPDGSIAYPGHPVGPDGEEPVETVDLSEYTAEIVTWTTSTATPPGVRQPNHLAIVEFDVDGEAVRALGQLAIDADEPAEVDVEIGDEVEPVHVEQLREPGAGIREPDSQAWDGYRFRPVE